MDRKDKSTLNRKSITPRRFDPFPRRRGGGPGFQIALYLPKQWTTNSMLIDMIFGQAKCMNVKQQNIWMSIKGCVRKAASRPVSLAPRGAHHNQISLSRSNTINGSPIKHKIKGKREEIFQKRWLSITPRRRGHLPADQNQLRQPKKI